MRFLRLFDSKKPNNFHILLLKNHYNKYNS